MKKISVVLLAFLLFLPSCKRQGAIDVIEKKIADQSFADEYAISDFAEPDEVYYDYRTEEEYIPPSAFALEDIAGISGYMVYDNKYYYEVKTKYDRNQHLTGISMMAYTDLKTGEKRYVCPDPLCVHAETWECPYVNQVGHFLHDGYLYGMTTDFSSADSTSTDRIWRINLTNYSLETLYSHTKSYKEEPRRSLWLPMGCTIWDGRLYFSDQVQYTDEEKREETQISHLWYLDLTTKEAVCVAEFPEEYSWLSILAIADGRLYCNNNRGFLSFDLNFENMEIISDRECSMYCCDSNTGELYYLVCDNDTQTGTLYVYQDGVSEKVNLPHENIYSFQLTNSRIYYSPYDFLVYGTGARSGQPVGDLIGGKIYAVNRNLSGEAALIYDGGRDFRLQSGYVVLGDHLYFDYYETRDYGNGTIAFASSFYLKKVRIDLKEHTIRYMRFD